MIRVTNLPTDSIDDVRDKLVKRFFENLDGSSFAGVVIPRGSDGSYREIIPLTLGHAFEWMSKALVDSCRTGESKNDVMANLAAIHDVLFKPDPCGPKESVS